MAERVQDAPSLLQIGTAETWQEKSSKPHTHTYIVNVQTLLFFSLNTKPQAEHPRMGVVACVPSTSCQCLNLPSVIFKCQNGSGNIWRRGWNLKVFCMEIQPLQHSLIHIYAFIYNRKRKYARYESCWWEFFVYIKFLPFYCLYCSSMLNNLFSSKLVTRQRFVMRSSHHIPMLKVSFGSAGQCVKPSLMHNGPFGVCGWRAKASF